MALRIAALNKSEKSEHYLKCHLIKLSIKLSCGMFTGIAIQDSGAHYFILKLNLHPEIMYYGSPWQAGKS
jgi:hypothetical protein